MSMDDVSAQCHMYSHRNFSGVGFGQNTHGPVTEIDRTATNKMSQSLAHTYFTGRRSVYGFIHIFCGFARHAEPTATNLLLDVFGSCSRQSNFEIVNRGRAIHSNAGNQSSLHEIVDNWSKANFNDMSPQPPNDRFIRRSSV